jgi:hypothetical protein
MAQTTSKENPEIKGLKRAITQIDELSTNGFSEIAAVAKMALAWMETPRGYNDTEVLAAALKTIWEKADTTENSISYEADQVGCATDHDGLKRRLGAKRLHRETLGATA